MSQAMMMLAARNRWCATGTPFTMDQTDLCNQLKFIGLQTTTNLDSFRRSFPLGQRQLLDLCTTMMRHTKDQERDGEKLLELGDLEVQKLAVPFSKEEAIQYKKLFATARSQLAVLAARGITKGIQVMSLLSPLRLACSGAGSLDVNRLQ